MPFIIRLFVAGVVGATVLLIIHAVLSLRNNSGNILEARLQQFGESGQPMTLAEAELSLPLAERILRPAFTHLARLLSDHAPAAQQQSLQDSLNLAGRPYGLTVGGFLAVRFTCLILFAGLGYLAVIGLGMTGAGLFLGPVAGAMLGYLFPQSTLSRRVRKRQKEIRLGLPSALDLLTISVEAGLGFDAALSRVTEKYKNALSAELQQTLNEIRLGRQRAEALDDLGRRAKVEELNNFVQAIIQSEQLGVGIANVLRIQSEEMRRRRRQRAEEQGQKAPLKMLLPMVGCIFPTLFIVLLGPALVLVMHQFGGK